MASPKHWQHWEWSTSNKQPHGQTGDLTGNSNSYTPSGGSSGTAELVGTDANVEPAAELVGDASVEPARQNREQSLKTSSNLHQVSGPFPWIVCSGQKWTVEFQVGYCRTHDHQNDTHWKFFSSVSLAPLKQNLKSVNLK